MKGCGLGLRRSSGFKKWFMEHHPCRAALSAVGSAESRWVIRLFTYAGYLRSEINFPLNSFFREVRTTYTVIQLNPVDYTWTGRTGRITRGSGNAACPIVHPG